MKLLYGAIFFFSSIGRAHYRPKVLGHPRSFTIVPGQGIFQGINITLIHSPTSKQLCPTIAPEISKKYRKLPQKQ